YKSHSFYESAKSIIIIIENPIIKQNAERFLFTSFWDSGITFDTTTSIMAPAAKLSAYGSNGCATTTNNAPITPATGSTVDDNCPYQKLLILDIPCALNGIETANP